MVKNFSIKKHFPSKKVKINFGQINEINDKLKDKNVFFNKLFKSCISHKREIKKLKETLQEYFFKMDIKEHIVKELQDKISNENIVNESLAAENEFLNGDNSKLIETLNNQNEELLKTDNQEIIIANSDKKNQRLGK